MTDVSSRIASLSPKQRALLERRMQQAGLRSAKAAAIPTLPAADAYELSFGQQRLWFIDQLAPGSPAYNIPFAGRLEGPLDLELLQRALDEIVRRHEILRTTFPLRDAKPVQVVTESVKAPLRFDDLTTLPAASREAEAERRVNDEARIPFDLVHGPVLRIRLLRLAADDHMLLVTMPHIVTDAWSMAVFFRELPALYEAFGEGKPSPLPELPIQFRDYAAWQRREVEGEKLDRLLSFWKRELEGAPTLLELPGDFPRPAVHRFRGRRYAIDIPDELTRAVRELAKREGVTMYMMAVAAFAMLLERYTGHDDILVGSPVATRERAETEGLIGFFINTLVVRTELKGNPTFRELLGRVRERCLAGFANQELPFEKLVETLGLDRDLGHQPLVQVTLVLQNVHIPPPLFRELRLTHFQQTDSRTAKVDLMLGLWESGDDLNGWLEYNVDLFAAETIERMGRHFVTLLESIVAAPERPISELAMMSESERRDVLETWNATDREYPRTKTIGELFDEQAAARGDAIALELGETRLTYAELRERADAMAARLRELGVGPGARVAIQLERSIELVVAMLAVAKTGAAYVPLDPAYPTERLSYMLEDSEASLIIDADGCRAISSATSSGELTAESPAYIIYTSGSTGKPKGVVVPHRAVVRLVKNNPYAEMTPEETFLHFAPATFDAATFEVWGALLNGARLVIQPPGRTSLEELGETIRARGVTTLWLTAGLFHAMADERLDDLRGVRQLLAGGDVVSAEHVKKVLGAIPGITAINGYGPTEATTFTCCHRMKDPEAIGATVPIGKPIANTKVYVLDRAMQPLPAGVAGELYIGGDGLALGYANAPELTASRFVPNPFGEGKLYRTGDRVRWNRAGELEFLGRLDDQVKVRGFRIEPGEIESALRDDKRIGGAVVVARKDDAGVTTLIAYVTPAGEGSIALDAGAIREDLRRRVPEHMVPAHVIVVDAFPLTANGKVDRAALAALPVERAEITEDDAPRDAREEALAAIWRDVLKLERVGIHDNFFELGGDSISALLVVSRARQAGLALTPASLFENPTIAALAAVAARATAIAADDEPSVGPLPLPPVARWFFETVERDVHHWNMAVPLRCRRGTDPILVEQAIAALIAHHDALRLRAEREHSGRWRAWIAQHEDEPPFRLHAVDLRGVSEEEAERIRLAESDTVQASLDLVGGPIVRAIWFEREGDPELLLVAHHLAVDGVSWGILLADLESAYASLARGITPALVPAAVSLRGWSRRLAETTLYDDQLEQWIEICGRDAAQLPLDRAGPHAPAMTSRALTQSETRQLLHDVPRAYRMGADEMSLAAFAAVLARLTGDGRIRLDVERHGRETGRFGDLDLSRTVGWLTTIAPAFFDLGDASDPGATLREVKEHLRAIPDRGAGFGVLRYLRQSKPLRALPPREVSFNYLGTLDALQSDASRFAVAEFPTGAMRSPHANAPYRLSLDAYVLGERLHLHLTGVMPAAALEQLADAIAGELRTLIEHAVSPNAAALTPSDFPEADLDAAELQRLLATLGDAQP